MKKDTTKKDTTKKDTTKQDEFMKISNLIIEKLNMINTEIQGIKGNDIKIMNDMLNIKNRLNYLEKQYDTILNNS